MNQRKGSTFDRSKRDRRLLSLHKKKKVSLLLNFVVATSIWGVMGSSTRCYEETRELGCGATKRVRVCENAAENDAPPPTFVSRRRKNDRLHHCRIEVQNEPRSVFPCTASANDFGLAANFSGVVLRAAPYTACGTGVLAPLDFDHEDNTPETKKEKNKRVKYDAMFSEKPLGFALLSSARVSRVSGDAARKGLRENDRLVRVGRWKTKGKTLMEIEKKLKWIKRFPITLTFERQVVDSSDSIAREFAFWVRRGGCSFDRKASNVHDAGASAMILVDSESDGRYPSVVMAPSSDHSEFGIVAVSVTREVEKELSGLYEEPVRVQILLTSEGSD